MHKIALGLSLVVICFALVLAECDHRDDKELTVGNKDFTEQYIVGQLIKQVLEEHGFKVNLVSDLSSIALREGIEAGDIDICVEYTGTAWMVHLANVYDTGMDNNALYQLVRQADSDKGLLWLNPIWNNNTYALASWPEFVREHRLKTLSDLASLYREKRGGIWTSIGTEFSTRPDGLPALENHYNFKVAQSFIIVEDVAAPLEILKNREADVAMVFGTDAEVAEYGWYVYVDDKAFFPPYDLTPCIRKEVLDKYPQIVDILNELVSTFPGGGESATPGIVAGCQKVWQELNARADIEEVKPDRVAREYLAEHGLIKE